MMAFAAAVAAPTATCVISYFRQQKDVQRIDPIAMIFTFALRTLKCFEGAKLGATEDRLQFYTKDAVWPIPSGTFQAITRAWYQVGNDDAYFCKKAMILFLKGWKAKEHPRLVEIVNVAISGLKKISEQYATEHKGASVTFETFAYCLEEWKIGKVVYPQDQEAAIEKKALELLSSLKPPKPVQALPPLQTPPLSTSHPLPQEQPTPSVDAPTALLENAIALLEHGLAKTKISVLNLEHAVDDDQAIEKLKEIWKIEHFASFADNLKSAEKMANTLKQFLIDQYNPYKELLKRQNQVAR